MPNFYHLDTGIVRPGQHYWELARLMQTAAQQRGFTPYMVGTQAIQMDTINPIELVSAETVWCHFTCSHTSKYSLSGAIRYRISEAGYPAIPTNVYELMATCASSIRKPSFSQVHGAFGRLLADFKVFFQRAQLTENDVVLLATSNEFECLALSRALHSLGLTSKARIAVYFHFGIFPRPTSSKTMPARARLEMFKKVMRLALRRLKSYDVRLFATSPGVTRQLLADCNLNCSYVPYPVFQSQSECQVQRSDSRVRIAIAGVSRQEQGGDALDEFFSDLDKNPEAFSNSDIAVRGKKAELDAIQAKFSSLSTLNRYASSNPDSVRLLMTNYEGDTTRGYWNWLANSDIGVFLYDAGSYQNRASGTFLEMLSLGIPVVVPSQTTMSETLKDLNSSKKVHVGSAESELPMAGIAVSNPSEAANAVMTISRNLKHFRSTARSDGRSYPRPT